MQTFDQDTSPPVSPDRTVRMFNDVDLSGWKADMPLRDSGEDPSDIFSVRNRLLVSTDRTYGHLVSTQSYRNYRLEVEYRLPPTGGNGSVLVHVSRLRMLRTKSKNVFPQSIEIKIRNRDAGDIYCVRENIEVAEMEKHRPREAGQEWGGREEDARHIVKLADAENAAGEWNLLVVEARERTLRVLLNRVLVASGFNCTADSGRIALQAGGSEIQFRRVDLGPLPVTR